MKIEEEIRQDKFRNERHKAGINLIFTSNWYFNRMTALFKRHNLTPQQYNILRILRGIRPKPVSVKYIRERMLDKMSDVSRIVEKLREKGLVSRHECGNDRRNVDILITEQGMALLENIDQENNEMEGIFATLSEEELSTFNTLLDKLRG